MIRKEECKHKQLIQYQSFAPQCQDCGVYMVTRKRNPLSSKSFFDFSEEEQKEILNQAADDSNKAQQEHVDKYNTMIQNSSEEGYYDSNLHWHVGKPPTKGNTPEIPDSSEAWEKEYSDFIKSIERDEVFITEGYAFYDELKDFIHTLLKHKESMTLQTVREKVEALPKLVTPDFNDAPLLNRHDVLKLLERR